jgi:anti-sigma factor RsiW
MNAEMKNPVCEQYESLLEDSVEGQLEGPEAQALAAHVNTCANCRAALDEARSSSRLLSLGEATPDPGPAFTHQVMARIRTEAQSEDRSLWRLMAAFARPFAVSATLALGIMLAYSAYWAPNQLTDTVTVQQSDTHELLSDPGAVPATADDTLMMVVETDHGKQ